MAYSVVQKNGPVIDQIRSLTQRWRNGEDTEVIWAEFRALYMGRDGSIEIPETAAESPNPIHMITLWFPFYCNVWHAEGTYGENERMADRLERENPGTEFRVHFEY